jgi:excisionase family DNA binding protein
MEITFDTLPGAVAQLQKQINEIHQLLLQGNVTQAQATPADELLTVQDAAKFLSLSVPTVYGLISKREIPVMKRSKRCYFSKAELINYLKAGRKKTNAEIEATAQNHVTRKAR